MTGATLWDDLRDWLAHLPVAFAYRIIWLCARLDLGSARMVYRAMWNANLSLPPLRDSDGNPKGGDGTAPSQSDDSADPKGIAQ